MEVDRLNKLLAFAVEADRSMGLWLRSLALSILGERANWEATPIKPNYNISNPVLFLNFAVSLASKLFDVAAYYTAGMSQDNVNIKLIGAAAESNLKHDIHHEKSVRSMQAQIMETIMVANGRQLWELARLLVTSDIRGVYMITSVWPLRLFAEICGQQDKIVRAPMNWLKVKLPLAEIL